MLKIVGTENGKVMDEKVILTEEGKLTGFGVVLVACVILADIGVFFLIGKIVKCCRRKKNKKKYDTE